MSFPQKKQLEFGACIRVLLLMESKIVMSNKQFLYSNLFFLLTAIEFFSRKEKPQRNQTSAVKLARDLKCFKKTKRNLKCFKKTKRNLK